MIFVECNVVGWRTVYIPRKDTIPDKHHAVYAMFLNSLGSNILRGTLLGGPRRARVMHTMDKTAISMKPSMRIHHLNLVNNVSKREFDGEERTAVPYVLYEMMRSDRKYRATDTRPRSGYSESETSPTLEPMRDEPHGRTEDYAA